MNIQTDIVPGDNQRLPRVDPDPHPDRPIRQRGLDLARRAKRIRRSRKRDKEGIPLGPDLTPP